jgi:hypothetical protein
VSTNYYLVMDVQRVIACPCCGRPLEARTAPARVHIGKVAAGWVFLWQAILVPESMGVPVVTTAASWLHVLRTRVKPGLGCWTIQNEYGDGVTLEEFERLLREHAPGGGLRADLSGPSEYLDVEGHHFNCAEFS